MADMFAPLVAQLKANPKTIVFTEGNDPRILEAASKLLAEGVLKVVMVGNEAECKAAAAAGNFDISAAEIIDPENYAGFDEMVNTMDELRKGKLTALPIENLSMTRETNLVYHRDFAHKETLQDILALYKKQLREYGRA